MNRNRFDVVVICFVNPGALAEVLARQGIRVISRLELPLPAVPFPENRGIWKIFWAWVQLKYNNVLRKPRIIAWIARVLNREKVDIAHFFLPNAYVFGMLACLLRSRAKRVMSRVVTNSYQKDSPVRRFLERSVMHRWVHRAIGNCRRILEDLHQEGISAKKTRLLYNGIDPGPFHRQPDCQSRARTALGLEENGFVMVAVGNLHTRKRYFDLIEACALAADGLPKKWRLLVAGSDQEGNLAKHTEQIRQRGLGENIRLLGFCGNVQELLFAADLLVHPSEDEGFPNAVLEAMAASLPVVASWVGGIPEQIIAGPPESDPCQPFPDETGWLVPPRNPERLSQALLAAAADPKRLQQMGERARHRVLDHFTLERSIRTYEALYKEIMQD